MEYLHLLLNNYLYLLFGGVITLSIMLDEYFYKRKWTILGHILFGVNLIMMIAFAFGLLNLLDIF